MQETYKGRYYQRKKQRRRRQIRNALALAVIALVLASLFWLFTGREPASVGEREQAALPVMALNTAAQTTALSLSEIPDTRLLELVNHQHPVQGEPEALSAAWVAVPAQSTELYIHETALSALEAWFEAANRENMGDFFIASGYRSREEQAYIYEGALDRSFVKPPGHSEHQTGLAIDIGLPGILLADMAGLPEVLWLAETAWRHGFILRYPEWAYDITGIAFEPWHFRYVGRPHAFYMWENDLVLEQYIDILRKRGVSTIHMDGRTYEVWHQMPREGMIYVPAGLPFHVSGDNMGGYIVTVEKG